MAKLTKKQKVYAEKIDSDKQYAVDEALALIKDLPRAKFTESVDVAVNLGVDPRKSDQVVRGSTVLPNGTGKTIRVAVFAQGENADKAKAAGADIAGSNCGNGCENMISIAEEFLQVSDLPVIIQPNAGIPVVKNGNTIYPEEPLYMAEKCLQLKEAGIGIIGGCCGTTPTHIRAIVNAIKQKF